MATKQHATFGVVTGWVDAAEAGIFAQLWYVNHPRFGHEDNVTTSRVVRIDHDDRGFVCEVETLNTIYTRAGMEHAP